MKNGTKRDYANMNEITFSFSFDSPNRIGVEEGEIKFHGPKIWGGDHTGWAAPLLRVQGRYFLAKAVADSIFGDGPGSSYPGIKYGPGGRRKYWALTETLVEKMMKASVAWRKNEREERIAYERGEFVMALVDLL